MSIRRAITFDFHDTLASCDRWFELEVCTLPEKVVGSLATRELNGDTLTDLEAIRSTYRALRTEIVGHGREMDALAGVRETLRRLGLSADDDALIAVIDDLMHEALNDVRPKPGAVETVTSLHEAGFALGVVSSAVHHPFLLWVLDAFSILPLFQTVVTSASAGFYKSRPEIYQRALDDLAVDPDMACHVGDSVRWDHLTPKSLGMRTILVSTRPLKLDATDPHPDLHLPSLLDSTGAIAEVVAGSSTPTIAR